MVELVMAGSDTRTMVAQMSLMFVGILLVVGIYLKRIGSDVVEMMLIGCN